MPDIIYENLILEVTRRCNMECEHCMRGNAQNKDMSFETAKTILDTASRIDQITFSGGEPTLNTKLIQTVLDYVKEKQIPVYSFYIVTNGKAIPDEFLLTCMKWYAYCQSCDEYDSMSGVALSEDMFHDDIPEENRYLLKSFSFYSTDKIMDFGTNRYLIPHGRAADDNMAPLINTRYKPKTEPNIESYDDTIEIEMIYVSADGTILPDCDYAYDTYNEYTIGNTNNIPEFLLYIKEHCNE